MSHSMKAKIAGGGCRGATNGRGFMARTEAILRSRTGLRPAGPWFPRSPEAEGGCGVTGFACTIPVGGRRIYEPSIQMRNRGNGKGGGIAACGLVPEDLGVSRKVLDDDYILQVALLDSSARGDVEKAFIEPYFDIDQGGLIPTVDDYRDVPLLEVRPTDRGSSSSPAASPRPRSSNCWGSPIRRCCARRFSLCRRARFPSD